MRRAAIRGIAVIALIGPLLAGCGGGWFGGGNEKRLPGDRISIMSTGSMLKADERLSDLGVTLPRPDRNHDWPHAGGYPNHAMHHLAAPGPLVRLWSVDSGKGSNDEGQLLTQPVVANGRIYTMDIEAEVMAFDADTGSRIWQSELSKDDGNEGTLGGGLAVNRGRLFATTGFGDVISLDAKNGREIWRRRVTGPIRAAPTVYAGRVFVVTVTNELFALSADDGRQLWTHSGLVEVTGLIGGAAPAADNEVVVVPYTSGEVVALRVENGREIWTETLSALRRSNAVTALSQIRGRPVIDRGLVYVVANSKRTVAIDLRTGTRLWEVPVGGRHGVWVAGEFAYLVTQDAKLICLTRRGGRIRWVTQLPRFEDEEDQEESIQWAGPVLVSDRLLVTGSQEEIWSVSPYTGKILGRVSTSGPVRISPTVARETVYLLTEDAKLIALR